jgi:hypothetical protein
MRLRSELTLRNLSSTFWMRCSATVTVRESRYPVPLSLVILTPCQDSLRPLPSFQVRWRLNELKSHFSEGDSMGESSKLCSSLKRNLLLRCMNENVNKVAIARERLAGYFLLRSEVSAIVPY